jgi:hypothetical protein
MNQKNTTLLVGGAFMFLGFILLLAILSKARLNEFIANFWPIILVFFGLMFATQPGGSAHGVGWAMLWLGVLMILRRIGILGGGGGGVALVLLLVLSGLFIIAFTVKPTHTTDASASDASRRAE